MLNDLNYFYENQKEPYRSCFLALRSIILNYSPDFTEASKYKLPFFIYKNKNFCYLWQDKKTKMPYIGINHGVKIEHPALFQGDRKQFKLLYVDPSKDIPIDSMYEVFDLAVKLYK